MSLVADPTDLRNRLHALSDLKRLAFLLACAERMYPNYLAFHRHHGWGEPQSIRRSLDLIWLRLEGADVSDGASELLTEVEKVTPDTEDFDSLYVSPALDAAVVASILLESVGAISVEKILEGLTLATDTIDMYVQELDQIPPSAEDLESRIDSHPLMQKELRRRLENLETLEHLDLSDPSQQAKLKLGWRNPETSSIGLS